MAKMPPLPLPTGGAVVTVVDQGPGPSGPSGHAPARAESTQRQASAGSIVHDLATLATSISLVIMWFFYLRKGAPEHGA